MAWYNPATWEASKVYSGADRYVFGGLLPGGDKPLDLLKSNANVVYESADAAAFGVLPGGVAPGAGPIRNPAAPDSGPVRDTYMAVDRVTGGLLPGGLPPHIPNWAKNIDLPDMPDFTKLGKTALLIGGLVLLAANNR